MKEEIDWPMLSGQLDLAACIMIFLDLFLLPFIDRQPAENLALIYLYAAIGCIIASEIIRWHLGRKKND